MKPATHATHVPVATTERYARSLLATFVLSTFFASGVALAQPTASEPTATVSLSNGSAIQLPLGGGLQVSAPAVDSVPWVLAPDSHPNSLFYREPQPLTGLMLDIPSEAETRIMLPGVAADAADRARFVVNKYITNAIGLAAQARGAQLDAVNAWVESTNRREQGLSADPWVRYQFSLEARKQLESFRERVATQSGGPLEALATSLRGAVAQISPLLTLMPTYETRLAWYNVLVQLKEGMALYQAQVANSDGATLGVIDQYLSAHPAVARPVGKPPAKTEGLVPATKQRPAMTSIDAPPAPRVPTKPLNEAPQDTTGGLIVALGIVASIVGFFLYLRKRNKATPGKGAQ